MLLPSVRRSVRATPLLLAATLLACGSRPSAAPPIIETAAQCEGRRDAFAAFVREASPPALVAPTRVSLPESTLGSPPGGGHLFELTGSEASLDGEPLAGVTREARIERFRDRTASLAIGANKGILYVAADGALEIRALRAYLSAVPEAVELRLLVRTRAPRDAVLAEGGSEEARRVAERLWSEPDPARRRDLAAATYGAHGDCAEFQSAVSSVSNTEPAARWKELQAALLSSLPSCPCGKLDTASLRLIVGAELRAGAASLGWVPLGFLRDPRCDASMPLRAVQKLVGQIEEFDAEFSGTVGDDALRFQDVLVNDRLRVYFCDALPGELLAAKQRARSVIHFRVPGLSVCDAFAFEPLAPASPMGTLRRAPSSTRPPLALHYWQGAEEIRLFGPLDPAVKSLPTDEREYPCNETLRLLSVDEHAITLEGGGRWFMRQDACNQSAEDTARTKGCVAGLAEKGFAKAP